MGEEAARAGQSHLPFLDVLQLAAEGLAAFGHLALHHQVVAVCPQSRAQQAWLETVWYGRDGWFVC